MSNRGVGPSNDAFAGGAQQRNLAPPGVGGGIGSANTRVSAPVAGVSPGQIKSALNNSTSNIGVPYTRFFKRIKPLHLARHIPRDRVHTSQLSQAHVQFFTAQVGASQQ